MPMIRKLQNCPSIVKFGPSAVNARFSLRAFAVSHGSEHDDNGTAIPASKRIQGPYFYDSLFADCAYRPRNMSTITRNGFLLVEYPRVSTAGNYGNFIPERTETATARVNIRRSAALATGRSWASPHGDGANYLRIDGSGLFFKDDGDTLQDWAAQPVNN